VHVSGNTGGVGGVLVAVLGVVVPVSVNVLVSVSRNVVPSTANVLVAITEVVATESELTDIATVSSEEVDRAGVLVESGATVWAAMIVAVPMTAIVASPASAEYAILRIRSCEPCMPTV
jgi:hypothetical protein